MNHNSGLESTTSMEGYTETQSLTKNVLIVAGALDIGKDVTELHLASGQVLLVPTATLLNHTADESNDRIGSVPSEAERASQATVIPLLEEQLEVGRRVVPTGTVILEKYVEEYQEALNEPLAGWTYDIERVPHNRVVDFVPESRQEGNTTIYPIIEERVVLTKQLVLREELHVTKRVTETLDTQVVTLTRENIAVRREKFTKAQST